MQSKRTCKEGLGSQEGGLYLRGLIHGVRNKTIAAIMRGYGAFTCDDLLSKDRYEFERSDLLEEGRRIKARRRIRLGSTFSLLFENRVSIWLQIQEELRWIATPLEQRVTELLDRYNGLLVGNDELCATLFIDSTEADIVERYATSYTVEQLMLTVTLGGSVLRARALEATSEQLDSVTYLRFAAHSQTSQVVDTVQWCDPVRHEQPLLVEMSSALRADLTRGRSTSSLLVPTPML